MKIYLFNNFSKRENSTKQPLVTSGTQFDCTLKEPTSAIRPTVIISKNGSSTFQNYGYAYIPDFYRWYWITDMVSDGPFWIYSMETDVLATYKAQIGAWSFYVLRSSHSYNGKVTDSYYPILNDFTETVSKQEAPYVHISLDDPQAVPYYIAVTKGTFILGVVADPDSSGYGNYGSIKYIAVKYSQLKDLINYLMNDTILDGVNGFQAADASIALQKSLVNPISYIKSCIWVPFDYDDITGSEENSIVLWTWTIPKTCKRLTGSPALTRYFDITIPAHPSASSRGSYLNNSPYTQHELYFPPFGLVPLDSFLLINEATFRVMLTVDMITGTGNLEIWNSSGRVLQKLTSQIGVPIQLSEVGYDYSNLGASAVGIGAEFVENLFSGLSDEIAGAASWIGNAANAMRRRVQTIGGNGNFSDLNGYIEMISTFYAIAAEDNADIGRPLCAIKTPSTVPGFIQVRNGDMELPNATSGEHAAVKNYLESGFWYE